MEITGNLRCWIEMIVNISRMINRKNIKFSKKYSKENILKVAYLVSIFTVFEQLKLRITYLIFWWSVTIIISLGDPRMYLWNLCIAKSVLIASKLIGKYLISALLVVFDSNATGCADYICSTWEILLLRLFVARK